MFRETLGISRDSDVTSLVADTGADLAAVGTAYPMGSVCRIIATGEDYILNSNKEWVLQG